MKRVLVTGANGQLGKTLRVVAQSSNLEYIFSDIVESDFEPTLRLDVTDIDALRRAVGEHRIDVIVNCAAYTNVDRAEQDKEQCHLLNAQAPQNLAIVAKESGALLIHISTDYVFGGQLHNIPYTESDECAPMGVYGSTKFLGEQMISSSGCEYVIIRAAWLYSEFGNNFCLKMLNLTSTKPNVKVVQDQVGTPTYALDLARVIDHIADSYNISQVGIYHYTNEGVCSWYDFAVAIASYGPATECRVEACLSDEYKSAAKRPAYSVLDKSKIKRVFGLEISHWTESLERCIKNLKK